jgi:hypothetical protein
VARKRNTQTEFRTLPSFDKWREEHGSSVPSPPKNIPPLDTATPEENSADTITPSSELPPFFFELITEQPRIRPLLRDEIPEDTQNPELSANGMIADDLTSSTDSEDTDDSSTSNAAIRERSSRMSAAPTGSQERGPKPVRFSVRRTPLSAVFRGLSPRRRMLVGSITVLLCIAIPLSILFGTGYLAVIRPTQGISTAFGSAASFPVIVNTSATVKSGDVVLSDVQNSTGSRAVLIGFVRGINAQEVSLSDGTATRLVPLSSVKGVVIFPTPLTSR